MKYEYKVLSTNTLDQSGFTMEQWAEDIERLLNNLSGKGWELITALGDDRRFVVFRREART